MAAQPSLNLREVNVTPTLTIALLLALGLLAYLVFALLKPEKFQ